MKVLKSSLVSDLCSKMKVLKSSLVSDLCSKMNVLKSSLVSDLCSKMESCNFFINEECIRNPDELYVVRPHHQLV